MNRLLRLFVYGVVLFFYANTIIIPDNGEAKTIDIASSPNLVGSGARALGMGCAFISIADDATAASWNPAGLFQLKKPELSIVSDYTYLAENNNYSSEPEASGPQCISFSTINYFSFALPFMVLNRNMALTLSYQNLFDFNRQWDYSLVEYEHTSQPRFVHVQYDQKGNLSAMGIALSIRNTDNFAFGITCNLWDDWFKNDSWTQTTQEEIESHINLGGEKIIYNYHFIDISSYSVKGVNFNIGMLYRANNNLSLGFVLKTPFKASLEQKFISRLFYNHEETVGEKITHGHLHLPLHCGVGISWRLSKQMVISFDIFRTEWDDFVRELSGKEVSPISGLDIAQSDIDPTHQVRMGFEYLLIFKKDRIVLPLRCGIFYDPAPEEKNPDDIYGFSLGTGLAFEKYCFDIAYQYRYGKNIRSSMYKYTDFSQTLNEHKVYFSLVYHFGQLKQHKQDNRIGL